jgi:hypothetical protein
MSVSRDFILIELHTSLFHLPEGSLSYPSGMPQPSPMEVDPSLPPRRKNSGITELWRRTGAFTRLRPVASTFRLPVSLRLVRSRLRSWGARSDGAENASRTKLSGNTTRFRMVTQNPHDSGFERRSGAARSLRACMSESGFVNHSALALRIGSKGHSPQALWRMGSDRLLDGPRARAGD